MQKSIGILERVKLVLGPYNDIEPNYEALLGDLADIVKLSGLSDEYRLQLASDPKILELISSSIRESFIIEVRTYSTFYVRIYRGVLILCRNLVVNSCLDIEFLFSSLAHFKERVSEDCELYQSIIQTFFQIFANLSQRKKLDATIGEFSHALFDGKKSLVSFVKENKYLSLPYVVYLKHVLVSDEIIGTTLSSKVDSRLIDLLFEQFENVNTENGLDVTSSFQILLLQAIISHENFINYIKLIEEADQEGFQLIVTLSQIIISAKDDWDNYQTVSLLAWIWDLFVKYQSKAIEFLLSKENDNVALKYNHSIIIALIDNFSHLTRFESGRKFLIHYDALPKFLDLLKVVHENVEQKKLKNSAAIENDPSKKEYPEVKSILIEIVGYMATDDDGVKEKVRKYHGLELILSNCNIDQNEPFIRERAILCLKVLLANNEGNQNFVRSLEAKNVYDQQAIEELGYEASIKDGKLSLTGGKGPARRET